MQIVIDIPENSYNQIREGFYEENTGKMAIAIIDGVILPKKHGRLIDADIFAGDEYLEKVYGTDFYWEFRKRLDKQMTVLEADKER